MYSKRLPRNVRSVGRRMTVGARRGLRMFGFWGFWVFGIWPKLEVWRGNRLLWIARSPGRGTRSVRGCVSVFADDHAHRPAQDCETPEAGESSAQDRPLLRVRHGRASAAYGHLRPHSSLAGVYMVSVSTLFNLNPHCSKAHPSPPLLEKGSGWYTPLSACASFPQSGGEPSNQPDFLSIYIKPFRETVSFKTL